MYMPRFFELLLDAGKPVTEKSIMRVEKRLADLKFDLDHVYQQIQQMQDTLVEVVRADSKGSEENASPHPPKVGGAECGTDSLAESGINATSMSEEFNLLRERL